MVVLLNFQMKQSFKIQNITPHPDFAAISCKKIMTSAAQS